MPTSTRASLTADLLRLGVTPGGTLWVHSSYKSLGPVEGGATAILGAMEDALGPDGLLLLPAFHLLPGGQAARAAAWRYPDTPSTVGYLTEVFRQLPGTCRSDHCSHSVAARGRGAGEFVAGHRDTVGCRSPWDIAPWGATYGDHSPFLRCYRQPGAQVLMLGVDYHSATFCHLVEVLDWHRRLAANPQAPYYFTNRERLGEHWDSLGRLARGTVGQAACRLFPVRDFVDTLLVAVQADPARWFNHYPAS
jgi:aminoglycoside N3'-acetyltransferase